MIKLRHTLTDMREVILLRLGEVTIKSSRVRKRFESLLLRNIRDALSSEGVLRYGIMRDRGRIFVYTNEIDRSLDVLRRVFGITSLSHAYESTFNTLDDVLELGERIFKGRVEGRKFAVRARRVGSHEFTSLDIERELGSRLLPYSNGVDLSKPEITIYVEVRGKRVYFYDNVVKAYGGLPIGSEGKVVALVSGGFDSAVAAWYMLRRGAEVHYVFCNLGGPIHEKGVLSVTKVLADRWSYGYEPKIYIVDFRKLLREIRNKCDTSLLNVILKRYMYRAAERIAKDIGADAIVTGESLGQVSSQTLRNLYVSSLSVRIPILRPLIGFDKDDIISLSREIGTYEASLKVREYCGAFAEHPKTRSEVKDVEREETKVDVNVFEEALSSLKALGLRGVKVQEEDLEIDEIPVDAVVIDLSEKPIKGEANWVKYSFEELLRKASELDRNKTYVLICDEGGISLEAAHFLRKMGLNAYSLRGGYRSMCRRRYQY